MFPATPARSAMPGWYPELLASVARRVSSGRQHAVAAANQQLLATYWEIGRDILDRQDEEGWGAKVIDRLSADLRAQFADTRGFSPRNLKYMRAFAAEWPDFEIVQTTVAQLPWSFQITLLDKLSRPEQRIWYAAAAVEAGWSRNVLVHQIESKLHERSGKAITNFTSTLPPHDSDQAQQATRDPYLFDFVGNADIRREHDLERCLIEHVEKFLLELGQGFAFVGEQVRLQIDDQEFYADLLFYHLKLRCYKSKNNVVAEYALRGYAAPIGVAEWTTTLTSALPPEFESSLPTIEELEAELADPVEPR